MVIIIDGQTAKLFGSESGNIWDYAETLMRKGHSVWVLNRKTAVKMELF